MSGAETGVEVNRKHTLWMAAAIVAATTMSSPPARGSGLVAACEGDSPMAPFTSPVVTQTFTAGTATTVSKVDVKLQWARTAEAKLQVRIVYWPGGVENDNAPTPNVVTLGGSEAYRFTRAAGTTEWISFKFVKPVELLPEAAGSGAAYGVAVDNVEGKQDPSPTPTPATCGTAYEGGAAYTGAGSARTGHWPGKAKADTGAERAQYDVQFRVHP